MIKLTTFYSLPCLFFQLNFLLTKRNNFIFPPEGIQIDWFNSDLIIGK